MSDSCITHSTEIFLEKGKIKIETRIRAISGYRIVNGR